MSEAQDQKPEEKAPEPPKALEEKAPEKPLSLDEQLAQAREKRADAAHAVALCDMEISRLERALRLKAHAEFTEEPAFIETAKGVIPNPKAKK